MAERQLVLMPRPGREVKPQPGIRLWVNPLNGFTVVEVHYTADPRRRGEWRFRASPKYGGLRSWRWRKEQEIDWGAQKGSLVFEMWDPSYHMIKPFTPPEHWPRWIMFDPGWRNPASMIWCAVDIDTEPNVFGYRPVHIYREFYKARRSAETCAVVAHDWSLRGDETLEWVEEIVLDPAAKQEHQAAANAGDQVSDSADNVLQQFTRKIQELGWQVPVTTGNNDKSLAIEEIIARLGRFWMSNEGVPLYDAQDRYREPNEYELAHGAYLVAPTLFFHETAIYGAREMGKYRWRDWASNDVRERHNELEKPIDKDDHTITNVIRMVNLLRSYRSEDGIDLDEFTPRPKPQEWRPDDDVVIEEFEQRAGQWRRKAVKRRRVT